uniref:Uncharacterized protein n=1 Tax=Romanomermis culicivorax TaxID=13658 RepID=A0A915JQV8_ROMCU
MTITLIENSTFFVPADYELQNSTDFVIHSGLVEPYTTIVSRKVVGAFDILKYNGTNLILTNAYNNPDDEIVFMIFANIIHFEELQTLRLKFEDRVVEMAQIFEKSGSEFPDFEDVFDNDDDEKWQE